MEHHGRISFHMTDLGTKDNKDGALKNHTDRQLSMENKISDLGTFRIHTHSNIWRNRRNRTEEICGHDSGNTLQLLARNTSSITKTKASTPKESGGVKQMKKDKEEKNVEYTGTKSLLMTSQWCSIVSMKTGDIHKNYSSKKKKNQSRNKQLNNHKRRNLEFVVKGESETRTRQCR